MSSEEKLARIKETIGTIADFPKKGIVFKDIFPIFRNPPVMKDLMEVLVDHVKTLDIDCIVGLEARGFLLGPVISLQLDLPFVPIRKKGKLPGECVQVTYQLEYGQDVFEAQFGSIKEGAKVLIVDDLLATGGTLDAACQVVTKMNASVVQCLVIIALKELNGVAKVPAPVHTLLSLSE